MTPQERTDAVLDYGSDGMTFTSKDIAESLHLTPLQARRAIHPLVESGKILAQGNTRARTYRIKRKRARYGLLDILTAPTSTKDTMLVINEHPDFTIEAYEETARALPPYYASVGWDVPFTDAPQFRPSKWQRIVAFLKGE